MNTPNIRYFAKFVNTTPKGNKTPKFTIEEKVGFYPPMTEIEGRDKRVSVNLMEKLKEGENVPSMRLQAKNSLNLTGLKEYFLGGKLSGYAYGYPYDKPTYSKDEKQNPFYEYRDDGFLFIMHPNPKDPTDIVPTAFEMIVLENAKLLISAYCKQLVMGGFDEAIEQLRHQAQLQG